MATLKRLQLDRRAMLQLGAGVMLAAPFPAAAAAGGAAKERHGLSAFGELKYPADFHHFDYVNPTAPKGGTFSQLVGSGGSTFDSFNAFIVKGVPASDMGLTFASLMARAFDEPDAVYLLAADRLTVSDDKLQFRYRLREGITFHDGTPIRAADVVFSLTSLKRIGVLPGITSVLRDVVSIVAEDERSVRLDFVAGHGLDTPALAATMPIFSAAYYSTRNFDETTLEPPLGSGPYRVARFEQGRFVEFERVAKWWGADLPVSRGVNNFGVLSRPRGRLRGVRRAQLSVSRGVYLARLGHALRFSGAARRPRQARGHSRRPAVRRAGLADEYPAREIQRPPRSVRIGV